MAAGGFPLPNRMAVGLIAATMAALAFADASSEKIFSMTIVNGALPAEQRVVKVTKDDMVRLRVTSDAPGELHLHAYKVEMKLAPGKPAEIAFKAYATGSYPLEWHGAADKATAARRHGPEFAVLEVYPK